jgi:hypothetical protein
MTESLKYTIVEKEGNKELRRYAEHIEAEVNVVAESYREAVSKGFNLLAAYIFGSNVSQQNISMTTPVQTYQSQKIAMTTPVTVTGEDRFTVAFIMPSEYSMTTLPLPKDERVHLAQVSEKHMGAIRFPGYFQSGKIHANKEDLAVWLDAKGFEIDGPFIIAGYNPPWVPGFLARNEVLVKVLPKS